MIPGVANPNTLKQTLHGVCGSSFVELSNKSDGYPIHMGTGFSVIDSAISYGWQVFIANADLTYQYTFNSSGDLAFDHVWAGVHTSAGDQDHGGWNAQVSINNSWVLLDTGAICSSEGPSVNGSL
jgi:hypothetical protein